MAKNNTTKQEWQKNEKNNNNTKMTKINHQQPSEFTDKNFIIIFSYNFIHI